MTHEERERAIINEQWLKHQKEDTLEVLNKQLRAAVEGLEYCQAYFNGKLAPENNHPSVIVNETLATIKNIKGEKNV